VTDPVGDADVLGWAVREPSVVARYRRLVFPTPVLRGDLVWLGALSSGGHGRFWIGRRKGRGVCVIAHRFAWALAYGPDGMAGWPVEHLCDEPWCQNPAHLVLSSTAANTTAWWARRDLPGSPLRDVRGPRGRAVAIREAVMVGGNVAAAVRAGLAPQDAAQPRLEF
jgi:hypothetical protein